MSERRGAKNKKELIVPSTVKFKKGNNAEQTTENTEEVLKGSIHVESNVHIASY